MEKDKPTIQTIETPMGANFFKLNASSCESSTPGMSNSEPKGQLVEFQQFQQPLKKQTQIPNKQLSKTNQLKKSGHLGLRNLTIHIDDNFTSSQSNFINKGTIPNAMQFNKPNLTLKIDQQSVNASHTSSLSHSSTSYKEQPLTHKRQSILQPLSEINIGSQRLSNNSQRKMQSKTSSVPQSSSHNGSQNQSQSQYISKIERLTSRVLVVEQKLFYYEDFNKKLLKENEQYKNIIENNHRDAKKLSSIIKKKQQEFDQQRKRSQTLMKKVIQLEREKQMIIQNQSRNSESKMEKNEIKIRQKDQLLKQLARKNQKLQNINKVLQREIRQSDKKMVQMQKQMHRSTCNNFLQNVTRLKESSLKLRETSATNKQNQQNNTSSIGHLQTRKSLQQKKGAGGISKTHRTNSSNINLLAKKLGTTNSHLK